MAPILSASAAALLGLGCVVHETYAGGEVADAPPPAQVEVIPVSPGPDYVWIGGYWGWHGRWAWEGGHYAVRPHAHAVWEAGRWERGRRGYVWRGGHWR